MKLKLLTFLLMLEISFGAALSTLAAENSNLSPEVCRLALTLPSDFVALSPLTLEALTTLARLKEANSESPVLILGETGTGKEVFAQHLVANSSRGTKGFVTVNISGIPPELLATELFGSEKGAYTGANANRTGFVEQAQNGTLFFDEIGDLRFDAQVLLLRLLQNRTYYPVGSRVQKHANARFIFATHQNLEKLVQEGKFRADLYYRIKQVTVKLASLRERKEEIIPLALAVLEKFSKESKWTVARLSPKAEEALRQYPWPGNIRELESVVRSAALQVGSGGKIDPANLDLSQFSTPTVFRFPSDSMPDGVLTVGFSRSHYDGLVTREALRVMENAERAVLVAALARNRYDLYRTSLELQIEYHYLRHRIVALGIEIGDGMADTGP